jgi:hypothetical protein
MTTSENQRGPNRATVVALVIVAAALATLPALRGKSSAEVHDAVSMDCETSPTVFCQD